MPAIHQALLIGAQVEKVYTAITSQEGLSSWWTPGTTAIAEVNRVAVFPFGDHYQKEMKIMELRPFQSVKWKCIKGAAEWIDSTISFQLIAGDKKSILKTHPEMQGQVEQLKNDNVTLLIFRHDDWKEATLMLAECSYTWGQFLRSLKLYCETGKGRPWPDQHKG